MTPTAPAADIPKPKEQPAEGKTEAKPDAKAAGCLLYTSTTYRESDANGIAARAFYKHLGFSEGKLTEEFGCPVQEFVLKR